MDILYHALSYFRRRKYEKCIEKCSFLLSKNPYDEAAWTLKMQALMEQVYVDDVENDEEGIAETVLDDNIIATVSRPGTSLRSVNSTQDGLSLALRPSTNAGRPVTGFARPGTQSGGGGSMESALHAPRTAQTARPVTSASGRFVRLGTASMLSSPGDPFLNLSRLNFGKYANRPELARSLFEYIFHHENDVRHALELASQATEAAEFKDWWWKLQLGKCYFRLGLFREAEQQFRSSLTLQEMVEVYLYLGKVAARLDQPLTALDIYAQGLQKFPNDTNLLVAIARIHEGTGDLEKATDFYKRVLQFDAVNVEAIASIATQYFYTDQPEVALKFYRRLLQLGVRSAELYTNIGLCCYYSQQYDLCMTSFERALAAADKSSVADIYYNIGHVALGAGDMNLAYQNFRLALSHNNDHAEAYNNLGVLELRRGNVDTARAFFQVASTLSPNMFEPHYNFATLAEKVGDLQTSYQAAKRALEFFPNHSDSKDLVRALTEHFSMT